MDTYSDIIHFIGKHYVSGVCFTVLFILIVRKFFTKIDSLNAQYIIKWSLLFFAALTILNYLPLIFCPEVSDANSVFIKRLTGSYAWAYWMMIIPNTILPFLLLIKKIGNNIYFIFLLTVLMNLGWLLESFILHKVSFHSEDPSEWEYLPYKRELIIIMEGIIYGALFILAGNLMKIVRKASNT